MNQPFERGVTVVVPARNGGGALGAQLEALRRQVIERSYEVVVVDDGSTDETAALAARVAATDDRFRLIRTGRPRGISWARNTGAAAARYEYVVYCDADDVASPGWLQAMVERLDQFDVVGGALDLRLLNRPCTIAWRGAEAEIDGVTTTMSFLPYAVGASLGVRRVTLTATGGFDETLAGHEDVEFCWRAQRAGATLGQAQDAVMHYRLRDSLRMLARQRVGYGIAYAALYARYQHADVPPASWRDTGARWCDHAIRPLARLTHKEAARGQWVYRVSWLIGCAIGSVRQRCLCPVARDDVDSRP